MGRKRRVLDLVVVTPVFEDRASAGMLAKDIAANDSIPAYMVFVEDGSVLTPLKIEDIAGTGLKGEIVYLVRNVGHQRAIAVGLAHIAANYDVKAVVVMDSDGQDRPDKIAQMLEGLGTGADIVVAQRGRRQEDLLFRASYFLYRVMFRLLTGRSIQFGNFMTLSGQALRRLVRMQELWVHFAASVLVSGLSIARVPIDRGKRYCGKSQMNFITLLLHGMRAVMVFAEYALVRVGLFCVGLAGGAILLLGATAVLKAIGYTTPGWFSIVSGILVVIVIQAGILMFVTLMVAGIVHSSSPITRSQLEYLIDRVEHLPPHRKLTDVRPVH